MNEQLNPCKDCGEVPVMMFAVTSLWRVGHMKKRDGCRNVTLQRKLQSQAIDDWQMDNKK